MRKQDLEAIKSVIEISASRNTWRLEEYNSISQIYDVVVGTLTAIEEQSTQAEEDED